VLHFVVDGHDHGAVSTVDLGGAEAAVRTLRLEVADAGNDLDKSSFRAAVNGKGLKAADPGVEVTFPNPRHAVIALDLAALLPQPESRNTVSIHLDDQAVDDRTLDCTLSFAYVGRRTLKDGTIAAVDSVDPNPGWAEWWVMFDGDKMDAAGGTTAGRTWLSEGNSLPHWVRLDFPKPRRVSGIAIWWAYWKGFRSSAAYTVETWDGTSWTVRATVKDQKSTQTSTHSFEPGDVQALRIRQPAMAGHPEEPQYMWISELEILD
jgi:hypothetical protein